MDQVWVWPERPLARNKGRLGSQPQGVVSRDEPGPARNIRVPVSAVTPGHPVRVSFQTARRQLEWSGFEYYCPSDDDRAVLRALGLDPENTPWKTVEARLVATGFGPGELKEMSGPVLIGLLTEKKHRPVGDDTPPTDLINHEQAGEIAQVSASTIRRWIAGSRLPSYGVGRRVSEAELRERMSTLRLRKPRTKKKGHA